MNTLRVYEQIQELGVNENNLEKFVLAYMFYLNRKRMGWIPIERPCRMVYRLKGTTAMVVMPFIIPKYIKHIWGIEVNGVYYCLRRMVVTAYAPKFVYDELKAETAVMFGENAEQRPLELQTFANLKSAYECEEIIADAMMLLYYNGVKSNPLAQSRYWVTNGKSKTPLVSHKDTSQGLIKPYQFKTAKLRPILHANTKLDFFCALNDFDAPKQEAVDKCVKRLEESWG